MSRFFQLFFVDNRLIQKLYLIYQHFKKISLFLTNQKKTPKGVRKNLSVCIGNANAAATLSFSKLRRMPD